MTGVLLFLAALLLGGAVFLAGYLAGRSAERVDQLDLELRRGEGEGR